MSGTLITGGAGSLGREVARQIHTADPTERIVVYSRDEGKQQAMMQELPEGGPVGLRYMLGDICDTERITQAMKGCDRVVHAAALKMIDRCEYDPWEAIRINVQGTVSVAKACLKAGIKQAVFVSSDKSVDPVSTYGFTKALGEDAWIHANLLGDGCFFCVRYGNVVASNKSMFHGWELLKKQGKPIPVTHADATRFYWTLSDAASFVLKRLTDGKRGMIYVPSMHSYSILDIARTYGTPEVIGWRCPEKVHEILWTDHETTYTKQVGDYYTVSPETHPWGPCDTTGKPVNKPLSSGDDPQSWQTHAPK